MVARIHLPDIACTALTVACASYTAELHRCAGHPDVHSFRPRANLSRVVDDSAARRLARTYVWWQPADATLANPRKLLCQILRFGRSEDYLDAERLWGVDALRAALLGALRGDIDPKSEYFWRLRFGMDDQR